MAPGFLSKFVRGNSWTHTRDRSDASRINSSNSRPSTSTSTQPTGDTPSPKTAATAANTPSTNKPPTISINTAARASNESLHTNDSTTSSQPQFTVIPPSPLSGQASLSSRSTGHDVTEFAVRRLGDVNNNKGAGELSHSLGRTTSVTSNTSADDITPTPTPTATPAVSQVTVTKPSAHPSRPVTPTTPVPSLPQEDNEHENPETSPNMPKNSDNDLRHSSSNRSLNINLSHVRAATSPETTRDSGHGENGTVVTMTPIVESPTSLRPPEFASSAQEPGTAGNASLAPSRDADTVSLVSTTTTPNGTATTKEKKRPWKRSTTRQPTGLASALIASGTAMAHPTLSAVHQASFNSAAMQASQQSTGQRKVSAPPGSPPYSTRSPPGSSNHIKGKSADMSPASKKSKRQGSIRSGVRRASISMHSDNASEYYPEDRPGYYSGLDVDSDEEDSVDSESMLDGMEDIPVTGFAVASNRRNADFHELFPNIPEGDYLIEDYGCAIQREILVQGRLYVSENHICFHANIFGWITDLSIPMCEITSLEKRMTAYVIPNAIQITTRQSKYLFASFLSRETTYDVIYNIWRLARPEDGINSSRPSLESAAQSPDTAPTSIATSGAAAGAPKVTSCACGKDGHYAEVALDCVIPGTPDRIHNLVFASGFIKEFMAVDQKLLDIQISDWQPTAPGSNLLSRNMSYIKPLNASLGPKQTKCEIKDEVVFNDPEQYISTVTTTRTPDVPSGGVFSVKSKTCLSWASNISTRIIVTSQVEWTGRSFIRSIIEKSVIDGQRAYHGDLEVAMRNYIQQHQSEFIPEGLGLGLDVAALPEVASPSTPAPPTSMEKLSSEEEKKRREQERNQRGLQWAWDTFEGASQVAMRSTKDALELVRDAWEQSSSTTIMWFVIVALVISNLWSVILMGSREEAGRRKEMKKMEEREKWVQGIVTALWDELGKQQKGPLAKDNGSMGVLLNSLSSGGGAGGAGAGGRPSNPSAWKNEIQEMQNVLEQLEQRIKVMKGSLSEMNMEKLDQLD